MASGGLNSAHGCIPFVVSTTYFDEIVCHEAVTVVCTAETGWCPVREPRDRLRASRPAAHQAVSNRCVELSAASETETPSSHC
ncbi:hypothetical protein SAMN05192552_10219 [Natrinema hispanicum]|uniref:Uncharacterized protein n=1 Tax=Natrinema hispanicum TaxID=392421 RepID=A0A1G6UD98_9EURY|nr:hypothetical protein SAMN05192552_10219 [Natrinema hispanicum]